MPMDGKDKEFDEIQGQITDLENELDQDLKKWRERVRSVTSRTCRSAHRLVERAPQVVNLNIGIQQPETRYI
jgi:hypothetical protein